ncbi:XRE family transcriptional regulator [Streptomyces sp. NBC_00249]|uniref:helix-turn-helix domain-containing protein n=1 Tax=Streptomyces sp. NBC_00249 TaxID=2975690 RepID=UPI002250D139|nr:XRE family transcriptional regulator [Streptomyces sp. NBC_00249]MCX5199587.1 XRE family transcriptional regulator [Streptomyces sp. NBC_00249]
MDIEQLAQSLARNLRHWRTLRGLTLDGLAARAGLSRGMVIQVEQARTNPSLETMVRLADALSIDMTALLDCDHAPRVRVTSRERAVRVWSTDAGSSSTLLTGRCDQGAFELWLWRIEPGDVSTSTPHPPGTTELLHVTAGELTLVVDGESHPVPAGCSAAVTADVPHGYRNDGGVTVEMTMAAYVPHAAAP